MPINLKMQTDNIKNTYNFKNGFKNKKLQKEP